MSERYGRKDVEYATVRLAGAMGRRVVATSPAMRKYAAERNVQTADYDDGWNGALMVHYAFDQGYNVHEGCGTSGQREPFGSALHSARELCAIIHFTLNAFYERGPVPA